MPRIRKVGTNSGLISIRFDSIRCAAWHFLDRQQLSFVKHTGLCRRSDFFQQNAEMGLDFFCRRMEWAECHRLSIDPMNV